MGLSGNVLGPLSVIRYVLSGVGGSNKVSVSSVAMSSPDLMSRVLRAVIDVVTIPPVDTVSVMLVASATAVPPVVNNINVIAGNPDYGSNWWHPAGESGGHS